MSTQKEVLLRLSRQKNSKYFPRFKCVCRGLERDSERGLERPNLPEDGNENDNLLGFHEALKVFFNGEEEAMTFIFQLLTLIGCDHGVSLARSLESTDDIIRRFPKVMQRDIALKLVDSLGKAERKMLRKFMHQEREIPLSHTETVPSLTAAMFDEGLIQRRDHLHQIAACFNREHTMDSLPSEEHPSTDNLLDLTSLRTKVNKWRRKRRLSICVGVVAVLKFLISVSFLVAFVALIVPRLTHHGNDTQHHLDITGNSTVTLDTRGFNWNQRDINMNLTVNEDNVYVNVYQITSNDDANRFINRQNLDPTDPSRSLIFSDFKRQSFNYKGGSIPIYGVKGTILNFYTRATSSLANPGCLRINIYHDKAHYGYATGTDKNVTLDGVIDHSPCLPVGVSNAPPNSTDTSWWHWTYVSKETGYIYATFDQVKDVDIISYVDGTLKLYDLAGMNPTCRSQTAANARSIPCQVKICGPWCLKTSGERYHVFVKSSGTLSEIRLNYQTREPFLILIEFILLLSSGVFLVFSIVMLALFIFCASSKRTPCFATHIVRGQHRHSSGYRIVRRTRSMSSIDSPAIIVMDSNVDSD